MSNNKTIEFKIMPAQNTKIDSEEGCIYCEIPIIANIKIPIELTLVNKNKMVKSCPNCGSVQMYSFITNTKDNKTYEHCGICNKNYEIEDNAGGGK